MAGIKDYSTTQINNSSLNGISVAEGMLPSNLNNAIRALMKNTREWFNDSQWVEYGDGDGAYTATYASATSFTIDGVDVTPIYHAGRRIKLTATTPGTIYGTISSSSFSTNTTINVTWDSGSLSNEAISNVYIGALSKTNSSIPEGVIATATLADGSVTTIKIADSAVTTAKINDAAVTNAKLGADSVNGSKIADDSINSEHYVDGSIDTQHIADAQITTAKIVDANVTNAKLATNAVTTVKIADSNITTAKIADSNITNAKIGADAVTNAKIADDSIDSEHYVDGSIDTQHIANSQITTAKLASNAVTTAKITDSNITTAKIANDAVTADKIADAVIVTNAEASGHTPNDTTFFTTSASDGRYFRQDSSETIASGDTWSGSDSYIATTAAIDARIIDLVDDVGGFVAIANEDSFPTTNPDINNGTGTIVSIADAGGMTYNTGTGVSTDAQTTAGATVTINSIPASIGSPIPNQYGMLVETTATLNTYTFHRLVPIATEVTTVASVSGDITTVAGQISPTNNVSTVAGISSDIQTLANIEDGTTATNAISNVGNNISSVITTATNIASVNNFGNVYRISATAPTTSLDAGDLYFDTTVNELKVYGASGWQSAGSSVNGTSQRYNYTATSGQTTFTGADNNGNTLTYDAGYIDVYLNGVKLLNGTDVTVSSGTSVVLATGATAGDIVDIVAYGTFSVASLNADNLDSGTVPSARLSGAYTGITQTGTLTSFTSTGIDDNATSTAITIDSSDRVGINTTSPQEKLHIETPTGSASETGLKIRNGTAVSDVMAQIKLQGGYAATSGEATAIISGGREGGGNASKITFSTGTTSQSERMRITSSGKVGIGTSNPLQQVAIVLDDSNTTITNGFANLELSNSNGTNGTYSRIYFNDTVGGAGAGIFGVKLTDTTNNYGQFEFWTRGSSGSGTRMVIDPNGQVGIGTASPSQKLDVVGSIEVSDGIYIGGTGTANKLDDYEEGTYTITTNANLTANAAYATFQYTKIGRQVTVNGGLVVSAVSGTDNVTISLPFTSKANPTNGQSTSAGSVVPLQGVTTGDAGLVPLVGASQTNIYFFKINNNGATLQLTNADLAAGDELLITVTYFVS